MDMIKRMALCVVMALPLTFVGCSSDDDKTDDGQLGDNPSGQTKSATDREEFVKNLVGGTWMVEKFVRVHADGSETVAFDRSNNVFDTKFFPVGGSVLNPLHVVNDSVARLYYRVPFVGEREDGRYYVDVPFTFNTEDAILRFPTAPEQLGLLSSELQLISSDEQSFSVRGSVMPPMGGQAQPGDYNTFVFRRMSDSETSTAFDDYVESK